MLFFLLASACALESRDLCFSPGGHCDAVVVHALDAATTRADVAIYGLNRSPIVDAIIDAKKRGVAVRVLLDNVQSAGKKEQAVLRRFDAAGVPHHHQHHKGIMHLKLLVTEQVAIWGSFNWTDPATLENDEVLSVARCPDMAALIAPEFEARWQAAEKAERK